MNTSHFNSIADIMGNKVKVTIDRVGYRNREIANSPERKKLYMANAKSDSVSINSTAGHIFNRSVAAGALSCGGLVL